MADSVENVVFGSLIRYPLDIDGCGANHHDGSPQFHASVAQKSFLENGRRRLVAVFDRRSPGGGFSSRRAVKHHFQATLSKEISDFSPRREPVPDLDFN
jgi:hypothetical protein